MFIIYTCMHLLTLIYLYAYDKKGISVKDNLPKSAELPSHRAL